MQLGEPNTTFFCYRWQQFVSKIQSQSGYGNSDADLIIRQLQLASSWIHVLSERYKNFPLQAGCSKRLLRFVLRMLPHRGLK